MPRTKPLLSGLLIVAGIAALSVAGNWAGRKIARAGLFPSSWTTAGPSAQAASPALPPRPRPAAAVRQDHLAAALKRLKAMVADSPNLALDFEACAAVDAILADLSAEELAEVYAGINPSLDSLLALKVGARWAALDPTSAMKAILAKTPGSGFNAIRVFNEWGNDQPAAALAWLASTDAPEALGEYKEVMQGNLLGSLVTRDYELATATFKTLAPDAASQVMDAWGSQCAGDPALRDRLVDFAKGTGKPLDYANLNRSMVQ
ncbi:MAG: hypothetical protein JWO82_4215, partial [Akkermansiaceae bacterium]|nr:hypothetical protein [Akkermansiaceae bacterium]